MRFISRFYIKFVLSLTLLGLGAFVVMTPTSAADQKVTPSAATQIGSAQAKSAQAKQQETDPKPKHPLTNKVWDVSAKAFISQRAMIKRIGAAKLVLIGERHGHSAHQNRTAFILERLGDRNIYPALVMEMLEPRQLLMVRQYRKDNPESAMGLGEALRWYKTGWPSWSFYEPIFRAAFTAKLPLIGADLPEAEQNKIKKMGHREQPKDTSILTSWKMSMKAAHCNLLGELGLTNMALLQWQRDQAMAAALLHGAEREGRALLLAGLAHIRRDRSVPRYVGALFDGPGDMLAIALMDVAAGKAKPNSYMPKSINGKTAPYDLIWFTPPKSRGPSTCKRLKAKGLLQQLK